MNTFNRTQLNPKPRMSQISYVNSAAIIKGKQGMYYVLDGEKYDIHFPLEWACSQIPLPECPESIPGPKYCEDCKLYGSIHGVFVAYCPNCAYNIFDGVREGILGSAQTAREALHSLSYMEGVSLSEIGEEEVVEIEETECHDDDYYADLFYPNDPEEREMRRRKKEYHLNGSVQDI